MPRVHFSVPGQPRGQGRPRVTARRVYRGSEEKWIGQVYKDRTDRVWEGIVREAGRPHFWKPIAVGVPVRLSVVAYFRLPPSRCRKRYPRPQAVHVGKPDTCNIVKAIEDALNTLAWADDSQVILGPCEKYTCAQIDNRPRTEIVIEWDGDGEQDVSRTVDFGLGPAMNSARPDEQARYLF